MGRGIYRARLSANPTVLGPCRPHWGEVFRISKKNRKNRMMNGHAAVPKSNQTDEQTSQLLQSHVRYTHGPSALKISHEDDKGGHFFFNHPERGDYCAAA